MEVIIKACGPLLLLLRLADSNVPTLCKIKGTVDLVKSKMIDTGADSLTDRISAAFHSHIPDLTSDIANAVYVLDPQQSKNAGQDVMRSFWTVVREGGKAYTFSMTTFGDKPVSKSLPNSLISG